jgi:hypothetical protein
MLDFGISKKHVHSIFRFMKKIFGCAMIFGFALAISANSAPTAKTDPLTGLPLYPATSNVVDPGNPTKLPEASICKSKMQTNFYSVYDAKVDATLAWCAAHLHGFRQTHGYASGRSQDAFYNADGTILISVTGSRGKEGENTATYSISYHKFTPGVSEKTLLGMKDQKIVCP